ncbi:MAG: DUF3267 domain-containing protein [Planctomycetes bacterium]|nr:DUF3267 domain-containing protein [Planctomycetota bacterium]
MIPGFVVALLTFPGVIVHEAAHLLFCKLRRVAVLDACFFRLGSPAGYVVHEQVKEFGTSFLIATGPFFVNSILCVFFCFPAFVPVRVFDRGDLLSYFLIWLGVSIGMHSFPSTQDARNLWNGALQAVKGGSLLAIAGFPLVVVIYVANILSIFWFDYLYGIALGFGLPQLVLARM